MSFADATPTRSGTSDPVPSPGPTSRDFQISTANHGQVIELGAAGALNMPGTWLITIQPMDASGIGFQGSIAILGRAAHSRAKINNLGMMSIPYRRVILQGVASDNAQDTAAITPLGVCTVLVTVPCSVGFLVSCTAGSAWIYAERTNGAVVL